MNPIPVLSPKPTVTWAVANPTDSNGHGPAAAGRSGLETAVKIEQTISFMMDNLNRSLQVSQLAAMANVSPSHYFALFKRRTGSAPMDYFTRLRMKHACRLLDTTTESVKAIAARLGYEDQFYFSRVFKSVNQIAPSQYREIRMNSGNARPMAVLQPQTAKTPTVPARAESPRAEVEFGRGKQFQLAESHRACIHE